MILESEIALVTGASRGIGAAISDLLGKQGAKVIGTATTDNGANAISQRYADAGIDGVGMVLDVTSPDSISDLLKAINEKYAAPSILINNAGITRDTLLIRMKEEDWDAIISTNLTSVFRMSKACLRSMTKARKGRIISVGSVVGSTGNSGQVNYASAKAGLLGFTKSLAREIGIRGITVNCVAPGFFDTDMTRKLSTQHRENLLKQIPLGRLGQVDDIAEAVLFLASPKASYITGETLHVNGGMYMA